MTNTASFITPTLCRAKALLKRRVGNRSLPFAQDCARRHKAPVLFREFTRERVNLRGGAHADRNQAAQQGSRHRQARAFGDVVHLTDDLDTVAGLAGQLQLVEQLGDAGRHAELGQIGRTHARSIRPGDPR